MCLLEHAGLGESRTPPASRNLLMAELRHVGKFIAFSEPAGCPQAFYHGNPPDSLEGPSPGFFSFLFLTIIETSNRAVLWSLNDDQSSGI